MILKSVQKCILSKNIPHLIDKKIGRFGLNEWIELYVFSSWNWKQWMNEQMNEWMGPKSTNGTRRLCLLHFCLSRVRKNVVNGWGDGDDVALP